MIIAATKVQAVSVGVTFIEDYKVDPSFQKKLNIIKSYYEKVYKCRLKPNLSKEEIEFLFKKWEAIQRDYFCYFVDKSIG